MARQREMNKNISISNARFYLLPTSNSRVLIELIHIFFVTYTAIQVPIWVCYTLEYSIPWLILESLMVIEAVSYMIVNLRTATYVQGIMTVELRHTIQNYKENGLLIDLIAAIPLNLIFSNTHFEFT